MIELVVGSLFISLDGNPVANRNSLGILARHDNNTFTGKDSIIVVWDNDGFAEYFESDNGIELKSMELKTPILNNIDLSTDTKITQAIKSSLFSDIFSKIKSNPEIQQFLK
ncbi:hypothetical protein [Thalassotalea piscium]|uniref:Uncharacterized protein n=1 Tax=Thalassotalea piscium TaxID=1230533 RepID=A0A7X0TTE1_9GAMM|nr:hypothetical protein [Thalassotalea piscium]MBB6543058.1 hypothetical protein [Thalassotalea piscium]